MCYSSYCVSCRLVLGEGARNGSTPVLMIVLSIRAVGSALVLQRSPLYSEAHQCLGGSLQVATGSGERPQSWEALTRQRARTQRPAAVRGGSCAPRQLDELPSGSSPVGPGSGPGMTRKLVYTLLFSARGFSRRGRAFKLGCNRIDALSNS